MTLSSRDRGDVDFQEIGTGFGPSAISQEVMMMMNIYRSSLLCVALYYRGCNRNADNLSLALARSSSSSVCVIARRQLWWCGDHIYVGTEAAKKA